MSCFYAILRWSEAGVFLVATILKLRAPDEFRIAVGRLPWISNEWVPPLLVMVISLELLAAILLVAVPAARYGAWLGLLLFATFFVYATWVRSRGIEGGCGCFPGTGWFPSSSGVMVLDLAGVAVSVMLVRHYGFGKRIGEPWTEKI